MRIWGIWIEHRCVEMGTWEPGATELCVKVALGRRIGEVVLAWMQSPFWPVGVGKEQTQVLVVPHCPWCGKRLEWEIPLLQREIQGSVPWASRVEWGHTEVSRAEGTSPMSKEEIEDIWASRQAEADLRRRIQGETAPFEGGE